MRVIVTGGAGFIGANIVEGLVEHGHEVVVIDKLSNSKTSGLLMKLWIF